MMTSACDSLLTSSSNVGKIELLCGGPCEFSLELNIEDTKDKKQTKDLPATLPFAP